MYSGRCEVRFVGFVGAREEGSDEGSPSAGFNNGASTRLSLSLPEPRLPSIVPAGAAATLDMDGCVIIAFNDPTS